MVLFFFILEKDLIIFSVDLASKLLSKQTYNLTAEPEEKDLISNFINTNYKNWIHNKEIKKEDHVVKNYTREETTKSLIKIIEKI